MGAKVSDVMTGRPRAVTPQTPLTEVAELIEAEDVGVRRPTLDEVFLRLTGHTAETTTREEEAA